MMELELIRIRGEKDMKTYGSTSVEQLELLSVRESEKKVAANE